MERHCFLLEEVNDDEEGSIEEEKHQGDVDPVRILKSFMESSSKPRSEVPTYDGNIDAEELMD